MLSPLAQRIVGVLVEKDITVPDSYPLTENALLGGCNQKSNRDPEMAVELDQLRAELPALCNDGWVHRVESGGRAVRFRHDIGSVLGIQDLERAILCELLVRGPQPIGALRGRMGRFGLEVQNSEVADALRRMAQRPTPLVEEQPRRPRERDHRWAHRLGDAAESDPGHADRAAPDEPPPGRTPTETPTEAGADLVDRLTALEGRVAALERRWSEQTD